MTPLIPTLQLHIRCVALRRAGSWHVSSLEFGLAARGDTFADARDMLHGLIQDFLHYALVGEDEGHTNSLLYRRASWKSFACFYMARLTGAGRLGSLRFRGMRTYWDHWDSEQLGAVRSRLQRSLAELQNRRYASMPPQSAPIQPSLDLIYRALH